MTHETLRLRPMGVGDLLDTAFRLYRRHFLLFVGIVAVIYVPLTLVQNVWEGAFRFTETELGSVSPQAIGLFFIVQLALLVVTFLAVQGLMNAAMARAVSDSYLGRPRGLVDTFRALGWRWLRLVGALILLGLIDVFIFLLFLIPCVGWIAGPIFLIYVNVPISSFLAPVVVVEARGAVGSLSRAFDLGRRKFWRVLGINLLLALLGVAIWLAIFSLLTLFSSIWQPGSAILTIFYELVTLVVTVMVMPIWLSTLTLLYFDLRIRLEGFDLELMVQEMDAENTVSA
jgi:hypothetical protein